jgi:hypothetical protein
VFSGNEPDRLDAFSKGVFYSDENYTVWDDQGIYEITQPWELADERAIWLYGNDPFLTKMRQVSAGCTSCE